MAIAAQTRDKFLCEQCRTALADPFWEPGDNLLPIAKLKPVLGSAPIRDSNGEVHPQQSAERAVYLSEQQLSGIRSSSDTERIQVACLLLEDSVPCRFHWPRNVTMRVNAMQYRPYGRSTSTKMGINQRDEAANVASLFLPGRNTVEVQAAEAGTWLLSLHRAKKRTLQQVKNMMAPKEAPAAAITRVKHLLHGGNGGDDGIAVESQIVSLKDPMSGQRMTVPARFSDASGLQAFDLDSFLFLAQRSRKWQDPMTLQNSTIKKLQVDSYMEKVLQCVGSFSNITEIEINDEGKWRPEGSSNVQWLSIEETVDIVCAGLKSALEKNTTANGEANKSASPGDDGVFLSDSDSDDEEQELREAAAAVRPAAALIGQKRKAPNDELDVIDLCSDSDEEEIRTAPVAAAGAVVVVVGAIETRSTEITRPGAMVRQEQLRNLPKATSITSPSKQQPVSPEKCFDRAPGVGGGAREPHRFTPHPRAAASMFSDATSPKLMGSFRPSLPATTAFLERHQREQQEEQRDDGGSNHDFQFSNSSGAGKNTNNTNNRLVFPLRPSHPPSASPPQPRPFGDGGTASAGGSPQPLSDPRRQPTKFPLRVNGSHYQPPPPSNGPNPTTHQMSSYMVPNGNGNGNHPSESQVSNGGTSGARFPPQAQGGNLHSHRNLPNDPRNSQIYNTTSGGFPPRPLQHPPSGTFNSNNFEASPGSRRPGLIPPLRPGSAPSTSGAGHQQMQMIPPFNSSQGRPVPPPGVPMGLNMPMALPMPRIPMGGMIPIWNGSQPPPPPPQSQQSQSQAQTQPRPSQGAAMIGQPRPMVSQVSPPGPQPPRPMISAVGGSDKDSQGGISGGGVDERILSQTAKEALEETRAILASDPSLVNEVNVDDWLI